MEEEVATTIWDVRAHSTVPIRILATALVSLVALVGPTVSDARTSAADTARAPAARIASVTFVGGAKSPMIIVRGHGLGTFPPRNPPYPPSHRPPLCGLSIRGNAGYDYGVRFYLVDESAKPTWAAGRYRPQRGELDCIGVVIVSFAATRVSFRLGSAYTEYKYSPLKVGSTVQIVVNGALIRTRVTYTHQRATVAALRQPRRGKTGHRPEACIWPGDLRSGGWIPFASGRGCSTTTPGPRPA